MDIKKNAEGYEEITLFETKLKREDYYSATSIEVAYEPDKDRFNIFLWKAGDTIEKIYGDWDIEEWLFVKLKHGKKLVKLCCDQGNFKSPKGQYNYRHVFEVLHRLYAEDDDAFYKLKKLMEKNDLPHKFDYYH